MEMRSGLSTRSDQLESALRRRKATIQTLPGPKRAGHEAREAGIGLIGSFLRPIIADPEPSGLPYGKSRLRKFLSMNEL